MPIAVPDQSAVGESQSNGVTERHVQKFEDLRGTHKASFDDNLKARVPSSNPTRPWLIEHVAQILNK